MPEVLEKFESWMIFFLNICENLAGSPSSFSINCWRVKYLIFLVSHKWIINFLLCRKLFFRLPWQFHRIYKHREYSYIFLSSFFCLIQGHIIRGNTETEGSKIFWLWIMRTWWVDGCGKLKFVIFLKNL